MYLSGWLFLVGRKNAENGLRRDSWFTFNVISVRDERPRRSGYSLRSSKTVLTQEWPTDVRLKRPRPRDVPRMFSEKALPLITTAGCAAWRIPVETHHHRRCCVEFSTHVGQNRLTSHARKHKETDEVKPPWMGRRGDGLLIRSQAASQQWQKGIFANSSVGIFSFFLWGEGGLFADRGACWWAGAKCLHPLPSL